jgi:hypothetical protein
MSSSTACGAGSGFSFARGSSERRPPYWNSDNAINGRRGGPDRHRRVWERGRHRLDLLASDQGGPEAASDRWKPTRAPGRAALRQFVEGALDRTRGQGCERVLYDLRMPAGRDCTARPSDASSRQPTSKGGDGSRAIGRSGIAALNRWTRPNTASADEGSHARLAIEAGNSIAAETVLSSPGARTEGGQAASLAGSAAG